MNVCLCERERERERESEREREREREREKERENFDITSYPEITSTSCQDFGYFVPRLDCNFVQDFTLTSYLDSTQY